jgi:hypothetical protein
VEQRLGGFAAPLVLFRRHVGHVFRAGPPGGDDAGGFALIIGRGLDWRGSAALPTTSTSSAGLPLPGYF